MNKEKLQALASELDSHLGGVYANKCSLNDIKTVLGDLREDMDNADYEDVKSLFREFSLKVRVLDDLMRYTVGELNDNHHKASVTKDEFFHEVRTGEIDE